MKFLIDTNNDDLYLGLSEEELNDTEGSDDEFASSIASLCMEYMAKRRNGLYLPVCIKLTKLIEEQLKELFRDYRSEKREACKSHYKEIKYKEWLSDILVMYNMESENTFLEWLVGRDCDIDCWAEGSIFYVYIVDFDKKPIACLGSIEVDAKKMKSDEEIYQEINKMISIASVLMDRLYGKNDLNPLNSYNYEFIYNEFIEFQESVFEHQNE